MAKKHTRNRRQKRRISRTRKMVGGAYSQSEIQQLQTAQFSENQIQSLQDMEIPFNEVIFKVYQLQNQVPGDELAEQVMIEILNEQIFQNPNAETIDAIPHAQDDAHDMDLSFNSDNGSLHMSDLDVTQDSMRANTTVADESFGNSSMSDGSMSSISSGNESLASEYGGKRSRRKTSRKGRKTRKSRKQRGGMCYGNGVGANSYDPNYSIYNTNMLKLFPYKAQ
jgi:hypothetical protein